MNYLFRSTIPDYVRKQAMDKANNKCQFPSCTARHALEIHHIDGNEQNNNVNTNLIVLCSMHRNRARGYRMNELVAWANGQISPGRRTDRS